MSQSRHKKKSSLMGKTKSFLKQLASDEKDPSKMTEEELYDKQLVEEFHDNGLDLSSVEQYQAGTLSGAEVIAERNPDDGDVIKGHSKKISGPVYVLNLALFYKAMGSRNERLVEGLIASSERSLKKYVADKGVYSLHYEDFFIVQFKDGCTPQNQQTIIQAVNEIGSGFLGESYKPETFVPFTLGEGEGEELTGTNARKALGRSSYLAQRKLKKQKQQHQSPDWKEVRAGQDKSIQVKQNVAKGEIDASNWKDDQYNGLGEADSAWEAQNVNFRPKAEWTQRTGERRRSIFPHQGRDRRKKKGRRSIDKNDAMVW